MTKGRVLHPKTSRAVIDFARTVGDDPGRMGDVVMCCPPPTGGVVVTEIDTSDPTARPQVIRISPLDVVATLEDRERRLADVQEVVRRAILEHYQSPLMTPFPYMVLWNAVAGRSANLHEPIAPGCPVIEPDLPTPMVRGVYMGTRDEHLEWCKGQVQRRVRLAAARFEKIDPQAIGMEFVQDLQRHPSFDRADFSPGFMLLGVRTVEDLTRFTEGFR